SQTSKRTIAISRVQTAGSHGSKRAIALSSVSVRIASVRRWIERVRRWRKPKTAKPQQHRKHCGCLIQLDESIHSYLFPLSPTKLLLLSSGSGRDEEPSGGESSA